MPPVSGLVNKNPVNVTKGKHIHNYSTFDKSLSYRLWNTHRFADYSPTYVTEGVENDQIHLNSYDRIDSLSLKAPFKGTIKKIKESFMVPNMAILPLQWDRIYAQPTIGDDVPKDANCIIRMFPQRFASIYTSMASALNSHIKEIREGQLGQAKALTDDVAGCFTGLLRFLTLGEYVYSNGSLLNVLGYKISSEFVALADSIGNATFVSRDFDWYYDQLITDLFKYVQVVYVVIPEGSDSKSFIYRGLSSTISDDSDFYLPFRELLDLFRDNPLAYISDVAFDANLTQASSLVYLDESIADIYLGQRSFTIVIPPRQQTIEPAPAGDLNHSTLNLTRLLAYQMIVQHFYTNSNVDFMYSAELYRQYFKYLADFIQSESGVVLDPSFSYNDYPLQYDYLSGHNLEFVLGISPDLWDDSVFGPIANGLWQTTAAPKIYAAWSMVFGFRKALRFGDYFTGSRPRPLAPINTDVAVNNGMVSVVNITRNIQAERFANAVMRTGRKIEEYVEGLFGRSPQPDYHNPFFLARQEEVIFGDSVQNTAETQSTEENSRTANFAGNLSPHTFTFHNDDMHPCIYMQIVHYDLRIAYSRSIDRQFMHEDRFDMFNPDFQYIGDQAIYGPEIGYFSINLGSGVEIPDIFSFTTRDMEYKQRFDVQSGGFSAGRLPGWSIGDSCLARYQFVNLSPDFIRWRNTDLDQLFLSLTGYSLGNYFHFICITDNNVSAKRSMAVDPQILG